MKIKESGKKCLIKRLLSFHMPSKKTAEQSTTDVSEATIDPTEITTLEKCRIKFELLQQEYLNEVMLRDLHEQKRNVVIAKMNIVKERCVILSGDGQSEVTGVNDQESDGDDTESTEPEEEPVAVAPPVQVKRVVVKKVAAPASAPVPASTPAATQVQTPVVEAATPVKKTLVKKQVASTVPAIVAAPALAPAPETEPVAVVAQPTTTVKKVVKKVTKKP